MDILDDFFTPLNNLR